MLTVYNAKLPIKYQKQEQKSQIFMEKKNSIRINVLAAMLLLAPCLTSAADTGYYANCGTRPTVVRVDEPHDRYYPFFVTLNRCGGSCPSRPGNQLCYPTSEEEVKITLFDPTYNKPVELEVTNHTTCGCMCVASFDSCRLELETWEAENCRCKCRYPNGPPNDLACKPGFVWMRDMCRCRCDKAPEDCPPRQVWNPQSCGCVCSKRVIKRCERKAKGLDYETCECVDVQALRRNLQEHPRSRMFITLLVGQGFLLVVIICVLIHYIRKSRIKSPTSEGISSSPPSHSDSGNMSFPSSQSTCDALTSNDKPQHKTSDGSIQIKRESTI